MSDVILTSEQDIIFDYTIEGFLNAVNILFFNRDKTLKKIADQFLCDFERRIEAWTISTKVLSTPNLEEEAYFFATQILKKKLRFDCGNYTENQDQIQTILIFLIDLIDQFKEYKQYLLSNLCKCFTLAMVFAHQNFHNIMDTCINKLNTTNLKHLMALIMIFNYLAEQVTDDDIVIDESFMKIYEHNLEKISDNVVAFLDNVIKQTSNQEQLIKADPQLKSFFKLMNKNIVECFKNWIEVGISGISLSKLQNDYSGISEFLFKIDPTCMETYSECICMLLRLPLQNEQMLGLGKIILNKVISYSDRVFQAIQMKDEDEINFFIDIFQHLCEYNLEQILKENRMDLLKIMVELTKVAPTRRIAVICDFWERFSMFLSDHQVPPSVAIENFGGLYKEIILAMMHLVKFDTAIFVELNSNKTKAVKGEELFSAALDYRKDIKLYFQDFVREYGFNYFYFHILFPELTKTTADIAKKADDMNLWARLEAEIFTFEAICKEIKATEDLGFLDIFLNTIFEIPDTFVQIKRTATNVLDELGNITSLRPGILVKAFNYLLAGLDNKLLIKYCSVSLKSLMRDNKEMLSQNKADLLTIYNEKVKSKALEDDTYRSILEGIVEVICCGDNIDEIKLGLVELMSHWIVIISDASTKIMSGVELNQDMTRILIQLLEVIKIIIRSAYDALKATNMTILTQIFEEIWPILKVFMESFLSNQNILEEITQIIKYFMRGMKSDFKKYLEEYVQFIIQGYKTAAISSYLYSFEIIVTVYGNDISVRNLINIVLHELCEQTFSQYLSKLEDIENNPQLSEDFFGMLYRLAKLNAFIILDSDLFNTLFSMCINYVGITHVESVKNIIYFICRIINFTELPGFADLDNEAREVYFAKVTEKVVALGDKLVMSLIQSILMVPIEIIFEQLKELIVNLIKNFREASTVWFGKHLAIVPHDCLTMKEKEKFMTHLASFNEKEIMEFLEMLYRRSLKSQYRNTKNNRNSYDN